MISLRVLVRRWNALTSIHLTYKVFRFVLVLFAMVSSIAVTPKDPTANASPHTKQVSKTGVYRTLKQRTKRDMHVCKDSGIQNEEGIKGKVRNRVAIA